MSAPNGSIISVYSDLSFLNCSQILHVYSSVPSGYYKIQRPNVSFISVYCDMEDSNRNGNGGWMSESGATCLPGLISHQYNDICHSLYILCILPVSLFDNQT